MDRVKRIFIAGCRTRAKNESRYALENLGYIASWLRDYVLLCMVNDKERENEYRKGQNVKLK